MTVTPPATHHHGAYIACTLLYPGLAASQIKTLLQFGMVDFANGDKYSGEGVLSLREGGSLHE